MILITPFFFTLIKFGAVVQARRGKRYEGTTVFSFHIAEQLLEAEQHIPEHQRKIAIACILFFLVIRDSDSCVFVD